MPRYLLRHPIVLLVSLAITQLVGCSNSGSSTDVIAPKSTLAGSSQGVSSTAFTASSRQPQITFGRVQLVDGVSGAQVTILNSEGVIVPGGTATTDNSGVFSANVALPASFRIIALAPAGQLGNAPEIYSSVYDPSQPLDGIIEVNAVTSIIDHYVQHHPGCPVKLADTRVKTYLGIPAGVKSGSGVYGVRVSRFSHAGFLRQARAASGGVSAYLEQLAAAVDSATGKQMTLGIRAVYAANADSPAPLSPIIPGNSNQYTLLSNLVQSNLLAETGNQYLSGSESFSVGFATNAVYLAEGVQLGTILAVASPGAYALINALSSVLSGLATTFFEGTVLTALSLLQQQLTALQTSVYNLQIFVAQQFTFTDYLVQMASLSTAIANIQAAWGGPNSANAGGGYLDALNALSADSTGKLTADGLVRSARILTQLQMPSSGSPLLSSSTIIPSLQAIQNSQLGNITPSTIGLLLNVKGTRYLTNITVEPVYAQFNTLTCLQRQAATMLSLVYKSQTPPDLARAAETIRISEDNIQEQYIQLPFPMPDDHLLYDRNNGLIYYNQVFAPEEIDRIAILATQFVSGNIRRWHQASQAELASLVNGGVLTAPYDIALNTQFGTDTTALGTSDISACYVKDFTFAKHELLTSTAPYDSFLHPDLITMGFFFDLSTGGNDTSIFTCNQVKYPYMFVAAVADQDPAVLSGPELLALGLPFVNNPPIGQVVGTPGYLPGYQVSVPFHQYELAPYFYWKSSDEKIATISNGSDIGTIHPASNSAGGQVTFTGTMSGLNVPGGSSLPITCTVSTQLPPTPARQLSNIFLSPHLAQISGALPQTLQLYVTGQYNDGSSTRNLLTNSSFSGSVSFASSDPNVTVTSSGVITASGAPAANPVTVTATVSIPGATANTTDTMSLYITN